MNTVVPISERLKLAAYLDEAGTDPASACTVLRQYNINYAVLRSAWNINISRLNGQSLKQLRSILEDNNISIVAIISDLGKIESPHLSTISSKTIIDAFNLAAYFQAGYIRIYAGTNQKTVDATAITSWMRLIADKAIEAGVTPLYEITSESTIQEPTDVARLLSDSPVWRLLYDPAQLVIKKNQDPFTRYWALLQRFVGAVDIHDYKIGFGFKPAGFGDSRIKHVIKENANHWYFIEPSLGNRYASATTRAETFAVAMEALENLLQ